MGGWVGGFEWLAGQLLSLIVFLLPVLATFGAVFLGVYLNGVVDREREREVEVFRPLFDETGEVKEASSLQPIRPLFEDGKNQSVILNIRPMEFYPIDQVTRTKVMAYVKAVGRLSKLDDPTLSASALLHESGYGAFVEAQLPDEMLLEPDEGIGSGDWASAPGPHIVAGRRTVIAGPNAVVPANSTQVSGEERRTLLPILVENAPLLVQLDSPEGLRAVFESHTDIDVGYIDEQCPDWADALWEALQQPWQSEPIDYEDGVFGGNVIPEDQHQNIVEGADFQEILTSAGIALQARRIKHRERVINRAKQLHERLLIRLSLPLYHPKRILLARR